MQEEQRARAETMAARNKVLADAERAARKQAEKLNREKQARIRALEDERRKLVTELD